MKGGWGVSAQSGESGLLVLEKITFRLKKSGGSLNKNISGQRYVSLRVMIWHFWKDDSINISWVIWYQVLTVVCHISISLIVKHVFLSFYCDVLNVHMVCKICLLHNKSIYQILPDLLFRYRHIYFFDRENLFSEFFSDVLNVHVVCKICLLHQSAAAKLHPSERGCVWRLQTQLVLFSNPPNWIFPNGHLFVQMYFSKLTNVFTKTASFIECVRRFQKQCILFSNLAKSHFIHN